MFSSTAKIILIMTPEQGHVWCRFVCLVAVHPSQQTHCSACIIAFQLNLVWQTHASPPGARGAFPETHLKPDQTMTDMFLLLNLHSEKPHWRILIEEPAVDEWGAVDSSDVCHGHIFRTYQGYGCKHSDFYLFSHYLLYQYCWGEKRTRNAFSGVSHIKSLPALNNHKTAF